MSAASMRKLKRHKYLFKERDEIDVKGKGKMRAYLLTGRKADNLERRTDESRINATHRIA
jgi:hypothetical protein